MLSFGCHLLACRLLGYQLLGHPFSLFVILKAERLFSLVICKIDLASRSPVVYWLGHPTLVRVMAGSHPIRNPLLLAKAVVRQPSLHLFGTSL